MSDMPTASDAGPARVDGSAGGVTPSGGDAVGPPSPGSGEQFVLSLVEETLAVSKRRRSTGIVRVGTRTETVEASAEVELDRYRVEVTRVPVGRVVAEVPEARVEGDTTVIPVVEERLVVVKQLVLVEEVRVRHVLDRQVVREPVTLRRQHAVIERVPPVRETGIDGAAPGDGPSHGAEGGRHGAVA